MSSSPSPPQPPSDEGAHSGSEELAETNELPEAFSEPTRQWFRQSFAAATRVQQLGWQHLVEGDHALLVAPTGSGKTLAAFLWGIDRCAQLEPDAEKGVRVLYVSPLKALAVDIERNLRAPLVGIQNAAHRLGRPVRESAVHVRTGDTPSRDRARQARNPCDIVVTTPESLFLTLGSQAATTLDSVDWVIVDEIHVFAPTKRGVHLALSLERLAERTLAARGVEPQRIGLSATVQPPDEVAKFLGGDRPVEILDASGRSHLELKVRVPVPDMENIAPEQRVDTSPMREADSEALMGPHKTAYLQEIGALPGAAGSPSMAGSDSGATFGSSAGQPSYGSTAYPKPGERTGIWPTVYPELIDLILQHRSTIVFTNSRGLCERLSQRLNELWADRMRAEHDEALRAEESGGPADLADRPEPEEAEFEVADLVAAHHGSVSHVRRAEIEERLKAGRLRCIVATSSLELGIDMGAVDLVVLVESPGSVARGLQRVGRAGHGVGELSRGVVFPKFKGDLLECAVVSQRMLAGTLEPISTPKNPLDVLAQQVAAACVDRDRSPDEILQLVRRSHPYRELSEELLGGVLDMLSGRFPSDDFADLRPRLSWDRTKDLLSARRGTKQVTLLNAGTIPDRGLYSVHLGADGPRIGELDEEMVYESRSGDVVLLGATSWRVLEITRDRVLVEPAPGEPGRMPFWRGDGPGRPIELGRALGGFLREMNGLDRPAMEETLQQTTPLEENSVSNLCLYLEEQKEATGALPNDRLIVVERFRDELGDWRICLLTPFGSRVHAPWAMALQQALSERAGFDIETMYTDDGIVLRLADLSGEADQVPDVSQLFPDADEIEDLVVDQVGSSALFASRFRENAARALLMPRRRAQGRTPLWLQRLRSKTLLAGVRKFANFPIVLETYRECLRDVFDLPALVEVLRQVSDRTIRVTEVETPSASPFARSLVYAYVAQYLYEQDSPLAERKAQALTLDRNLLRELVGQAELRELLDPLAIDEVEAELQCLATDRRARDADEIHDLLRRLGDLTFDEIFERCAPRELTTRQDVDEQAGEGVPETATREIIREIVRSQLDELLAQRRIGAVRLGSTEAPGDVAGERFIASEDAGRYRDALGVQPPAGLPQTLLEPVDRALESLVQRWAKTHGPFHTDDVAHRFALLPAQIEPLLENLERQGTLTRGEIRPGGTQREWCDVEVLRRIKRRTLARLRGEVAPVDATVLARYLPRWHNLEPVPTAAAANRLDPRNDPALGPRPGGYRPPQRSRPHPEAQLDEALSLLEGLALPWSTLSDALLPARVDGFRPESLDLRAASGEVVWLGRGALGPKDGRTALLRRDTAAQLARSPKKGGDDEDTPDEPIHRALLELLDRRGACFTTELHQRLRRGAAGAVEETSAPFTDLRADELEAALWDLVWAGLVTNDTFLPLRTLGGRSGRKRQGGTTRARAARAVGRPRFAPTRRGARGAAAGTLAGGRWSLVEDLLDPERSDTEWAWTTANLLLERYGVISRETALAEEVPGGFASLYPTLRAMEDAGRVRRGYFVEGLSGRQFALAGAVERLREARRDQEQHLGDDVTLDLLAAVDPASPYGALLPWPEGRTADAPRPRRVAGAWVVIADGELLGFVESGLRSLLTFGPAFARSGTRPACELLTAGLRELMKRRRLRSLRIGKLDGAPAGQSPLVGELLSCGWQSDDPGLRLNRDS